jgi:predicted transcriptional regulator
MKPELRALRKAEGDLEGARNEAQDAWKEWAESEIEDLVEHLLDTIPDEHTMYADITEVFNRITAGMPSGTKTLL